MKKKAFGRYQLITCTAIAVSAGDAAESDRQDAILVRALDACVGDADQVLFGYIFDEMDESTFQDACERDSDAFSGYYADLNSVLIDGNPLSNYVGGEL